MLHVLGMSHAISVLKSMASDGGITHGNWNVALDNPQWARAPLPEKFKAIGIDALNVFLIRPTMNWHATLSKGESGEVLAAPPAFWTLLESLPPVTNNDTLVSFIGGNDHSVLSLVEAPDPYDFLLPGDDKYPLIHGRQPIDVRFIEVNLERRMNSTVAMLTALRFKHPALRIFHAMPPPPLASERQILKEPEIFADVIAQYGITPLSVRIKVYLVYVRLLMTVLQRLEIGAIPAPADATDEMGGLKEAYSFGCTHGNHLYGALVADQLAEVLRQGDQHASV